MEQNKKIKTYENAKIYRIVDNTNGNQYIGSTCKTLSARLSKHKTDYKNHLIGKQAYITSYKILENNNFDIVLIENIENCKSKEELHKRERFYIDSMVCVNKVIPTRTHKEYKEDHKDFYKDYNKQYKVEHKEIIQGQWKEYYENNKTKLIDRAKAHYIDNKGKILQYQGQKHICSCGKEYTHHHKSRHERSKKHQEYLKTLI